MSILKTVCMIVVVVAASILAPKAEPIAAQACEACDHNLGECIEWIRDNQCLRGEHPDGSPFCANFAHECMPQQTSIDVSVQGTPLLSLPAQVFASSLEDVHRACDGAIIHYALRDEARAVEALTDRIVI